MATGASWAIRLAWLWPIGTGSGSTSCLIVADADGFVGCVCVGRIGCHCRSVSSSRLDGRAVRVILGVRNDRRGQPNGSVEWTSALGLWISKELSVRHKGKAIKILIFWKGLP